MPPRLPPGLVELSLLSLNAQRVPRFFYRAYQSTSTSEQPLYPTRLSLDGNQQSFQPQPQQDDEQLKTFHQSVDEFTEEELKAVYRDLLRLNVQEPPTSFAATIQDPALVLPRLAKRILPHAINQSHVQTDNQSSSHGDDGKGDEKNQRIHNVLSSLSSKLQSRLSVAVTEPHAIHLSTGKPYSELLNALQEGVQAALPMLGDLEGAAANVTMTEPEWISLVEGCLRHTDFDGAFTTLRLMKRSNIEPSKELYDHIMTSMAEQGLFREIQAFNTEFLIDRPNHPHLHYLLLALTKCRLYSTATTLLHTVENSLSAANPNPPPVEVYDSLIGALIRSPGPGHHARVAQAWDIFYNMRYLAHPQPSVSLYAKMIAACADSVSRSTFSFSLSDAPSSDSPNADNGSFGISTASGVDTHRGLDLWHEMTVTNRMIPTTEAYNSLISLLARSKSTAHQAYTYAQEMLDLGRDADGKPQLPLNDETLLALTEAAKRLGDVKMARWVMVKKAKLGDVNGEGVTQRVVMNAFHAYAAYKAPFKRDMAMPSRAYRYPSAPPASGGMNEEMESLPIERVKDTLEDVILPQTSQAVLAEADALFEAILQEKLQADRSAPTLFSAIRSLHLRDIALAYLTVYFGHSSKVVDVINKVREVHLRLLGIQNGNQQFGDALDLMCSPEMIRTCLFHCAKGKGEPEEEVKAFVQDLWMAWEKMEGPDATWDVDLPRFGVEGDSKTTQVVRTTETARKKIYAKKWIEFDQSTPAERASVDVVSVKSSTVSKAWASYIHFKVRCDEPEQAISLVRSFQRKYPPSAGKTHLHSAMPMDSSISLTGPRTLVKMSQRALVDDDSVPPIMVFTDVATLHKHLVQKQKTEEVDYLTWLLHAYSGAVRDRRGMNLWVGDVSEPGRGSGAGSGEEVLRIREKEEKRVRLSFERKRRSGRLRASLARRL